MAVLYDDTLTMNGYEYITDESTGEVIAVSIETGEVLETKLCRTPVGTLFFTPDEQEEHKERKERKEKEKQARRLVRNVSKQLGSFYFLLIREDFSDLKPATVTRLIYLNTFARYNNVLMKTERTPMKYNDLEEVLKISKSSVSRFWDEVCPKYIHKQDDKIVITDDTIFNRGLKRMERGGYIKMYIRGIRKLYEMGKRSNDKQLGYVFKMLPFINIEFNVLCYNPLEKDIENIEFVSLEEFCELIGYSKAHITDLLSIYKRVCFEVKGRNERFCSVVYDGIDRNRAKIFVNPHIMYSGTDYKRVELLGAFSIC